MYHALRFILTVQSNRVLVLYYVPHCSQCSQQSSYYKMNAVVQYSHKKLHENSKK